MSILRGSLLNLVTGPGLLQSLASIVTAPGLTAIVNTPLTTSPICGASGRLHTSAAPHDKEEDAFYGDRISDRRRPGARRPLGVRSILSQQSGRSGTASSLTPRAVPTPPTRPPQPTIKAPTVTAAPGTPPPPPAPPPAGTATTQRPHPSTAPISASAALRSKDSSAAARAATFAQLLGLAPRGVPPADQSTGETEQKVERLPLPKPAVPPAAPAPPVRDPVSRFIDPKYGFALVGGVAPMEVGADGLLPGKRAGRGKDQGAGSVPEGLGMDLVGQHPRVHPVTTFLPGQAYDPEDLNVFAPRTMDEPSRSRRAHMPTRHAVRLYADFKNVMFLEKFLTPAGRILPRRRTKLPMGAQQYVSRQIKVARQMALLPHEARLGKEHLKGLRQAEARAAGHLQA